MWIHWNGSKKASQVRNPLKWITIIQVSNNRQLELHRVKKELSSTQHGKMKDYVFFFVFVFVFVFCSCCCCFFWERKQTVYDLQYQYMTTYKWYKSKNQIGYIDIYCRDAWWPCIGCMPVTWKLWVPTWLRIMCCILDQCVLNPVASLHQKT